MQSEQGASYDRITFHGAGWCSLPRPSLPPDYWELRGAAAHYFGVSQRIGMGMSDDDDSGWFFDLLRVLVAIFGFIVLASVLGAIVWVAVSLL
jgi:hypothetical protein